MNFVSRQQMLKNVGPFSAVFFGMTKFAIILNEPG
jgi:hypothetical protein